MREPSTVRGVGSRLERERLIWRFRFGAAAFTVAQTAVEPGDHVLVSWLIAVVFALSVPVSWLALRGRPSEGAVRRLGGLTMGVDAFVVAAVMLNNQTDPGEPIYLVGVLAMLEAAMRWSRRGAAVGGLVAGSAAGWWTITVANRVGAEAQASHATMRFGVIVVLGVFLGGLVRRLSAQYDDLQRVLDTSRDLIATLDAGGTIVAVNAACEEMLGYRPEEMLGHDCREFLHPDERRPPGTPLLGGLGGSGARMLTQRRFCRADGEVRWLELNCSSVVGEDVVYVAARDVTERREVERQVSTSEQRFRSLFDHNADAVYSFDLDGRFTSANPATERMTGFFASELAGANFADLIAGDHLAETHQSFRRALAGEAQNYETVLIARDGRRVEINVTNMPIVVDRDVVGVFGVAKDVTERRRLERELSHQATHDSLTGLPNRAMLEQILHEVMDASSPTGTTLLFIDLDRFKIVNDSLGHRCGDDLLRLVAARLSACLRSDDVLTRWAGDEFCVLVRADTNEVQALAIADRILTAINEPFSVEGRDVRISATIGVGHGAPGGDPARLVQHADHAMYEAKRAGRSRVSVYRPDPVPDSLSPLDLEVALRASIESNALILEYQPIIELATGRIVAVESLVRWPLPDGTVRGPDEFIPLAEETGLIRHLTRWVIGEACQQLARWDAETGTTQQVHAWVNVSARDLQDARLVAEIVDALSASGVDAERLVLEVTETMLLSDLDQVDLTVASLRRLGVSLAIDDFGTGYSSMSQLHRLEVAACKIDRTFVAGAPTNQRDAAIIRSLADLGAVFGFGVVGEGVETVDQLRCLATAGCELAQGYLLARPCSPDALVGRLRVGRVDLPDTGERRELMPVPAGRG